MKQPDEIVNHYSNRVLSSAYARPFVFALALVLATWTLQADSLESGFSQPPSSAKPQVWWHWMNGNITREGITADLEAMQRVGIGGATIFNLDYRIPPGPVKFRSPEWYGLLDFAVHEAHRLGLKLSVNSCDGWANSGGPWNTPEHAMQRVTTSVTQASGPKHFSGTVPQPPTKLDFYQDIAVLAFETPEQAETIKNWEAKSGDNGGFVLSSPATTKVAPGSVVQSTGIVDLTHRLKNGAQLDWDVPAGNWTILRIGYTPTGRTNHPATREGAGLECDKFSKEAMDAHWKGYMQTVLDRLGPVASKTLEGALIDSYEVGGQNWTPQFREEFQRRRGYDLLKYLPALTGRVVDSPEISERFLWDMRRTIADLFAENYYGRFQELCHQHGLVAMAEPYTGPFESLQCGGAADLPMGEFWIDMKPLPAVKLASSVGHIYGKPVIGTESFTAAPGMRHARWQTDPYSLKTLGDLVFSQGINRFILHRFVMQPWTNRWPGMTMGKWGTEFDRTTTWWEPGRAWHEYVARCQYLLQQGRFVADAAYYSGESVPVEMRAGDPALPEGFDYDGINADVLLHQAKVRDGQLVLKSGMRYRVLILPPKDPAMTPRVLRQLRAFVADGLTIVGAPPPASPSLENYPRCDVEVRQLATELWGNCDGQTITEHAFGKGKVVWGQSLEKVLAGLSVKPDFSYDQSQRSKLVFIHRLDRSADIYFVANQRQRFESLECSFRVSGKTPELWNAQTGQIERAPVWRQENDRTIVPLRFDPAGSVFVVFREKAKGDHVVSVKVEGPAEEPAPARIPELRIVKALYGAFPDGGAVSNFQRTVDVTAKVAERVQNDALEVWANDQLGGNPAGNLAKELRIEYSLDGVRHEIANAQDQLIVLPDTAPPMGTPPAYRVHLDAEGKPRVWTSKPGTFTLTMASGRRLELRCDAVPAPVQISGAWDVRFPDGWNAPEQVTFERLESWTKNSHDGVKYFSGTAVYEKQLNVPGELMGSGRQVWLDLGGVKNLAEVFLNEQPLGILWKPPFRVNVSGLLKTGKNVLRIKVTNLWPNRLIGDEQLPPDCEWDGEGLKATDGKKLKAWPQWFLEGKPSPTGRVTFATWHHWTKDDPLLESGLLGPVRLEVSEELGARK